MEKIKLVFKKLFEKSAKKAADEAKYDHVVTIEEVDGRTEVTRTAPAKIERKKEKRKLTFFMDVLFCCLVSLLWMAAFSSLVRFMIMSQTEKNFHDYFYLSYFIIVLIVTISSIHFESLFVKGFERFTPRVAVVVKRNPPRKLYVLRIRMAGDKEFIETEMDESKLTYNDVLELCCKEMNVEKEEVKKLWKVPETRIRGDEDIKRFRRLEYLEIHKE